jgi:hypothetical protein
MATLKAKCGAILPKALLLFVAEVVCIQQKGVLIHWLLAMN